jgi:hypothetical protein
VHERLERKMDELKEAGIFFAEYTPVRAEGDVSATTEAEQVFDAWMDPFWVRAWMSV